MFSVMFPSARSSGLMILSKSTCGLISFNCLHASSKEVSAWRNMRFKAKTSAARWTPLWQWMITSPPRFSASMDLRRAHSKRSHRLGAYPMFMGASAVIAGACCWHTWSISGTLTFLQFTIIACRDNLVKSCLITSFCPQIHIRALPITTWSNPLIVVDDGCASFNPAVSQWRLAL